MASDLVARLRRLSSTTTSNWPLTSTLRPSPSTLPMPTSSPTGLRPTSSSITSPLLFDTSNTRDFVTESHLDDDCEPTNATKAVSDANKAIELDRSNAKAYLRKGTACFHLEEYQTAKAAFEAGASLVPEDKRFSDWINKCDKCIAEENGELSAPSLVATSAEVVAKTDAAPKVTEQVTNIAPAKPKYRHEFYQKPEEVVVTIFAKGIPADSVTVNFGEQILSVTIKVPGEEAYVFQPRLFGKIVPANCKYVILSTKIEIRLAKVEPIHWTSLEFNNNVLVARSSTVSSGNKRPTYPSSKPTKDWDKLEAQVKKEEKDEKLDGDAALNKFFREIYSDADEDTRRAMSKSFVESNGTVLSTNWKEVGAKQVEGTPPDGMELKKWEY